MYQKYWDSLHPFDNNCIISYLLLKFIQVFFIFFSARKKQIKEPPKPGEITNWTRLTGWIGGFGFG